jgi:uncharacterized membrane protein
MKPRMAVVALSLAGFFLALYLYLWKMGLIGTLACGTGACETVQLSPYSRVFGVEVTLVGIGGYLALVGAGLAGLAHPDDRRWPRVTLALATTGFGFTLYLTTVELFVLEAICRWCVGSATIMTLILLAALLDWRAGRRAPG